MSDAEYAALRDDIRDHGQREQVWIWKRQIIDGRHRARACVELEKDLQTREYDGDEASLISFVVSLNLHRRHLDESQRSIVAATLSRLPTGQETSCANLHTSSVSQAQAGELMNVSTRSVASANKVLADGVPELVRSVEAGEVAVSNAAEVAKQPKDVQRKVVAAGPKAVRAMAREARTAKVPKASRRSDAEEITRIGQEIGALTDRALVPADRTHLRQVLEAGLRRIAAKEAHQSEEPTTPGQAGTSMETVQPQPPEEISMAGQQS